MKASVVFWDIDGTLLSTARSGMVAWERAIALERGAAVDLAAFQTAGLTDVEIARALVERFGSASGADAVHRVLRAYEEHLPAALGGRGGEALPGARAVLTAAAGMAGVRQALLTGNLRSCAAAKLAYYGLGDCAPRDGVFGEDGPDRPALAERAIELARGYLAADFSPDRVFVVGDTPADVACGRHVGARTIGVATGSFDVTSLESCGAWRVLRRLPTASEFAELLRL